MPFRIVPQLVKDGRGEDAELVPVDAKVVGHYPKDTPQGREFHPMPPIIRLYIGNDSWGSPDEMPTAEEIDNMDEYPTVWTLTLNPRTANFNLHFGYGFGYRWAINPYDGKETVDKFKPESGTAVIMARKLADIIKDETLALTILETMIVTLRELQAAQAKRKAKNANKPKKAPKGKEMTPEQARRAQDKAEIDARRQIDADRRYQERLEAEARPKAHVAA